MIVMVLEQYTFIRGNRSGVSPIMLLHDINDTSSIISEQGILAKDAVERVESFYGLQLPSNQIILTYSKDGKTRPRNAGTFHYSLLSPKIFVTTLQDEMKLVGQDKNGWLGINYHNTSLRPKLDEVLSNLETYVRHQFSRMVSHESAHLFNNKITPCLDYKLKWLDEGIAEYVSKQGQTDGITPYDIILENVWKPLAKDAFEKKGFVDFKTPINLFDYNTWTNITRDRLSNGWDNHFNHYVLSHMFVKYLFDELGKVDRFKDVIRGKTDVKLDELTEFESGFKKVFEEEYKDVFELWKRWLDVKD